MKRVSRAAGRHTRASPQKGRNIPTEALVLLGAVSGCNLLSGVNNYALVTGDGGDASVFDGRAQIHDAPPVVEAHDSGSGGDAQRDATLRADAPTGEGNDAGHDAPVAMGSDAPAETAVPTRDASLADARSDVALATVDATVDARPHHDAGVDAGHDANCSPDLSSDPDDCGRCGHYCLGGDCAVGECTPVTLAPAVGSVGFAIDATYVYWADLTSTSGTINKIGKALTQTGTPTPIVSGAAYSNVQGIASDGTYIYWTNKTASGVVMRALPTGANLSTIATGQSQPDWLATNGSSVFWTNEGSNQVMSAPTGAGTVTPTQLNTVNEVGTDPSGMALDAQNVYYATKTTGGGIAEFVSVNGGEVAELGGGTFVGIGTDANNVYWTGGFANPTVSQNGKNGTTASVQIIASGSALTCPLHVVSDGTNVYFLDQGTDATGAIVAGTGALYRVPVGNTGPLPSPLVRNLTDPQAMAVDAEAVYWVNGTTGSTAITGSVMKLAK